METCKLVQKFLPKQFDIDKVLKLTQRKVLKGTFLPLTVTEILTGYLTNPYFKDIYLYPPQNILPHTNSAIRKVETSAERYALETLLFKLITTPEK